MLSPLQMNEQGLHKMATETEIQLYQTVHHVVDKFLEVLSNPPNETERDRLRINLISLKEVIRTDPQRIQSFIQDKLELDDPRNDSLQKYKSPPVIYAKKLLLPSSNEHSKTPSPSPCINNPDTPGRIAPSPVCPQPIEEPNPEMRSSLTESQKKADLLERVNKRTQNLLKNIEQRVKSMTENNELHQFLMTKNIVRTDEIRLDSEGRSVEPLYREQKVSRMFIPPLNLNSLDKSKEDKYFLEEEHSIRNNKQKIETPKEFIVVSPIMNQGEEEIDWESIEKIKRDLFGKPGKIEQKQQGEKSRRETKRLIEKINAELKEIDNNSHLFENNLNEVEKLTEEFKEKYKDYKLRNILLTDNESAIESDLINNQMQGEDNGSLVNSGEKIKHPMKLEKVLTYIYDFKKKFLSNTEILMKIKDKMKFIEAPSFLAEEEEAERSGSSIKNVSIHQQARFNVSKPISELSPNVNLKSIRIYRGESEKEYNYLDFSNRYNESDNSFD